MPVDASTLRMHLDYSGWASARLMEAARPLNAEELSRDMHTSHESLLSTLAHIFGADRIWLDRIHGLLRTAGFDPGETVTLEWLAREWPALHTRWADWAAGLTDADVRGVFPYRDLKGNPYESPIWQVVLHVVNHASVHRGQVVTMLRQLGHVPPSTDLIAYYRVLE